MARPRRADGCTGCGCLLLLGLFLTWWESIRQGLIGLLVFVVLVVVAISVAYAVSEWRSVRQSQPAADNEEERKTAWREWVDKREHRKKMGWMLLEPTRPEIREREREIELGDPGEDARQKPTQEQPENVGPAQQQSLEVEISGAAVEEEPVRHDGASLGDGNARPPERDGPPTEAEAEQPVSQDEKPKVAESKDEREPSGTVDLGEEERLLREAEEKRRREREEIRRREQERERARQERERRRKQAQEELRREREEALRLEKEKARERERAPRERERRRREEEEDRRRKEREDWERRIGAFRGSVLGLKLQNRYEWMESIRPLLFEIDVELEVEGLVVVALSERNLVRDVQVFTGTRTSVQWSPLAVLESAEQQGAKKLIVGHSHPAYTSARPSDPDVENAAHLHFMLEEAGMELADDLVVCRTSEGLTLKSVLATHRFTRMVREY